MLSDLNFTERVVLLILVLQLVASLSIIIYAVTHLDVAPRHIKVMLVEQSEQLELRLDRIEQKLDNNNGNST